jgi:predicted transcriptional regulator
MKDKAAMDPVLKGALSHARRIEILGHLMHQANTASTKKVARALNISLHQAAYHLTVLHNADLIARVKTAQELGRVEYSYAAMAKADT